MEQYEYVVQGDAEAAVIDILTNDTPELPSVPELKVRANMRGYIDGERRIVVIQQGSLLRWPKISRPRVDVECYAERRTVAKELAEISVASLFRSMGGYDGFGLKLIHCHMEQGPTRIPDKLQQADRYIFSVRLTVIPYGDALAVPFS